MDMVASLVVAVDLTAGDVNMKNERQSLSS
jgi:hypothetical protein